VLLTDSNLTVNLLILNTFNIIQHLFDITRHSRLATLLYKLRSALSDEVQMTLSLIEKSCQLSLTAGEITDVSINKVTCFQSFSVFFIISGALSMSMLSMSMLFVNGATFAVSNDDDTDHIYGMVLLRPMMLVIASNYTE